MTLHAEDEMDADGLSVYGVESAVLDRQDRLRRRRWISPVGSAST